MTVSSNGDLGGAALEGSRFAGQTIAITGAAGAIGRRLVSWFAARGAKVVAVGRDPARLAGLPGIAEACRTEAFGERLAMSDIDAVIDLAAVNSAALATASEYHSVNVERVRQLAMQAREAGVPRMVVVSSYHAADPDNRSAYADSKRALQRWADQDETGICRVVVLPKIHGADAVLGVRRLVWRGLASLKAAAFFPDAADGIAEAVETGGRGAGPIWVASQGHHRGYAFASRVLDITFAISVLAILGLMIGILVVAIRIDSAGPAIFRQQRVGRSERPFVLYKFRTMSIDTPEAGTHEVKVAAVTRVGRFLRRTKLDELPQAWNILRGELAVVGPRPCLLVQHDLIAERRAHGVFALRPGLTGLAQVNGIDMSDPRELVRWEVAYMRIRGLLLDLRIIWQTFVGRGGGDRTAA